MALDAAMDYGITEFEFWHMTLAEVRRANRSKRRVMKIQAQEKAAFDYIQAGLITKGVAKALGDKTDYPSLQEAYSHLFTDDEKIEKAKQEKAAQQDMLSALRFKQFANYHNDKF